MRLHDILQSMTAEERREFSQRSQTSLVYLCQLASGYRRPSPKRCQLLIAADPRLTREELRPDIYEAA